jgi:hypothetical protein
MRRMVTTALLVTLGLLALGGTAAMADRTHPCLYITSEDIARARENIQRFPWARTAFDDIRTRADKWTAMSDDQIRAIVPAPESLFAYGFSGCPDCGITWPLWGQGGICSLDNPGKVTCPGCKRVFPDAEHPDDGKGWLDLRSGRHYYFVGCYNTFVSQLLTLTALDDLTNAYALTGDEKYAHTAAVMFDAIAKIYPTCTIGSIDYPNHPGGRFERTEYQVARVLVFLARYYDLIYNSPSVDAPSLAGEPTIRKSIEERVLKNGAKWCFDHGSSGLYGLTNGEADYVRGVMCVGLVLGMQDYIDWTVSGPYSINNMIENNVHNDGQYYETSNLYSSHAIGLYRDMAEMLINCRSEKYPSGINLYEHPKFSKALVQAELDTLCAGHDPRYGDSGPDVAKAVGTAADLTLAHINAEHMYARTAEKVQWAETINRICGGDVEKWRADQSGLCKTWLLYHAEPIAKSMVKGGVEPSDSFLLDGKGICILRSGSGVGGRAAFVRYGPSVCHGHRDDLNLNFFALGRELTYDFGYSLGSAHVQTGWAHQTGSHNLVMVNEKCQLEQGPSGGSAELFATSGNAKVAELACDNSYKSEAVDTYRRTIALIDTDAKDSYLVDIFRVNGGQTHDLLWHGLGDQMSVEGGSLGDAQPGSLASADYEWGTKVGPDGDINGQADKGPYWTAPPESGYGFLYNVKRGPVSGDVSATWTVDAQADEKLRIDLLPPHGCELITAKGPGILPKLPHANFAILRRKGEKLSSTYVSVLQPFAKTNPVRRVESMKADKVDGSPAGVRVSLSGERTDYIFTSMKADDLYAFSADAASFRGRFGFCRFGANGVESALLTGASRMCVRDLRIDCEHASYWGQVVSVDYDQCRVVLNRELPCGESLVGAGIYLNRPEYGHSSYYKIRSVRMEKGHTIIDLDTGTLLIGTGYVGKDAAPGTHEIDNLVPLEMCRSCQAMDTGYFKGKLLVSEDGAGMRIDGVKAADGKRLIYVPDAGGLKSGAHLRIYDIQAGDRFEIPAQVTIKREQGHLTVKSTTGGTIKLGGRSHRFGLGTTSVAL